MTSLEYLRYLEEIRKANDSADNKELNKISRRLLSRYGSDDPDVSRLLRHIRYK